MREGVRVIEGSVVANHAMRIGIVASRFNDFIVSHLVEGAIDAFVRHGGLPRNIMVVKVPGAWEIPLACERLAKSETVDGIVALGAVIRGSTPHFDYVAGEVAKGVAQVSMESRMPISFGVLTTDTIEQAVERAGTKAGNKGWDAMMTAVEVLSLDQAFATLSEKAVALAKIAKRSEGKR
jgi:6,7-dimethyl-8-ribityllumazine synthase